MLYGTEKLLGKEYKKFCDSMCTAAENDGLPIVMKVDNTFGLTFQDISDLMHDFKKDTDLNLTTELSLCHECNRIHMYITVDYEYDEESNTFQ